VLNRFAMNPYFHLQNLLAAPGAGRWHFFREKLRLEISRARVNARLAWARAIRGFRPDLAAAFPHVRLADLYEQALDNYNPKPFPGEVTLFLSKWRLAGYPGSNGGWSDVARGGLQLFTLPFAPRASLVEPYVRELAGLLRNCIDASIARSPAETQESQLQLAEPRD